MNEQLSRRTALLAIGGTIGIAAVPVAAIAKIEHDSASDAPILAAWAARQSALARIEGRGTFFDAEEHSPSDVEIYDTADLAISRATARTPRGLLAQAWVALAYAQDSFSAVNQRQNAFIRRADLKSLLNEGDHLDWELRTIVSIIRSLRNMVGEA